MKLGYLKVRNSSDIERLDSSISSCEMSGLDNNPYGSNPAPPPQAYQPSMAGQYGSYQGQTQDAESHEHGYEWEQARQEEEERRKQEGQTSDIPPPGYDVATSAQNTGSNAATYAPPPGPPPGKGEGTV